MNTDVEETDTPAPEPAPDRAAMLAAQLEGLDDDGQEVEPTEGQQSEGEGEVKTAPAQEEPAWAKPPASWKKEYAEAWSSTDERIRQYVYQRDQEQAAGIEPLKTKAQFADAVSKVAEPYLPTIKMLGLELPTAIQALMQADYTLRNSPADQKLAYLAQLAAGYGVKINPADGTYAPIDPALNTLQQELQSVRGEVTTWKQQQEAAVEAQLAADIEAFQAKAEYFEEARPTMADLLEKGIAKDLPDAYEKAIRLNDDLFSKVQAGRQAQKDTEDRMAKARAAKAAKAAAVSVRSSTPGTQPTPKAQDRRSLLAQQFEDLSERL